jgi:hypothetical protein
MRHVEQVREEEMIVVSSNQVGLKEHTGKNIVYNRINTIIKIGLRYFASRYALCVDLFADVRSSFPTDDKARVVC